MKVVIVAKTRMGSGACVGAITADGASVRLIAADNYPDDNLVYNVGEVWELDSTPDPAVVPPHVENVIVHRRRKLGRAAALAAVIAREMPPVTGGIEQLFDGVLQRTTVGALYVASRSGLPARSTQFWRTDAPLTRDSSAKRLRYRHPSGATLTFVGFQPPPASLPAGTVVRVSLAHWWRPAERPDSELRCYVQLSGWLDDEADAPAVAAAPPTVGGGSPPPTVARVDPHMLLRRVFHYDDFRPLQRPIIDNVLAGRDTLAVLPTGGGKSLCYQLPALLFDGLTVVVSPLIALMYDQVAGLRRRGIPALYLNSTLRHDDYVAAARRVRSGAIKLLYLAPETLLRPETLVLLEESAVACLAIDEAHCISEWGHDFRPEYRQIAAVRRRFPAAVCLALTATATPRVRDDIRTTLNFAHDSQFVTSFDRPNLYLDVQPRGALVKQATAFVRDHRGQCGIIYCNTIAMTTLIADLLSEQGLRVAAYHAKLPAHERARRQQEWLAGAINVIAATIAFGMGIDKPDVRFVLHVELPDSIEQYYQQIGRAGRDGLPADCRLLFDRTDADTHRQHIARGAAQQVASRTRQLDALVAWAESRACRHMQIRHYFGEQVTGRCGHCDNCRRAEAEAPAAPKIAPPMRRAPRTIAEIRQHYPQAYRPWTAEEEAQLQAMLRAGQSIAAIARALQRKPGAISSRIKKVRGR